MPLVLILALASAFPLLAGPAWQDEVRVATFSTHTLVIAPDGTVLCQGRNQYRVCGADSATNFVEKLSPVPGVPKGRAVAVADTWTSMVLGEDGRVYVWGQNNFGLFGGTDRGPVYVRQEPTPVPALDQVTGIATVRTWGGNSFGSLGTGGSVDAVSARGVLVRSLSGIVRVWAGGNRDLALKSDGTLYLWGPSGSEEAGVFRVPRAIATFPVASPRKP